MNDSINQSLAFPLPKEEGPIEKFNLKTITPFFERSVSAETRRIYRRVSREFFTFFRFKNPVEINHADVHRWRDQLIALKKSDATIRLKLSVIR